MEAPSASLTQTQTQAKPSQAKPSQNQNRNQNQNQNHFWYFFASFAHPLRPLRICPRIPAQQNPFLVFFATSAHLLRLLRSAPVPVPAPSLLRLLANGWLFQGGGENLCHFYRIKAVLLAAKLAAYFDLALLGDDAVGFFLP